MLLTNPVGSTRRLPRFACFAAISEALNYDMFLSVLSIAADFFSLAASWRFRC
jgi:hypothetical protein